MNDTWICDSFNHSTCRITMFIKSINRLDYFKLPEL